jgi:hypothetical protein
VSSVDPNAIPLPSLVQSMAMSVLRTVLTSVGGVLVGDGIIQQGDQADFVKITAGACMALIAVGWSWWEKNHNHAVAVAAVAQAVIAPSPAQQATAAVAQVQGQP